MNTAVKDTLPHRHRIRVDEYYRMAEVGVLRPQERLELIDGEIIDMAPIGDLHAGVTGYLNEVLVKTLSGRAHVRVQLPVRLDELSEPQPDFSVVKRRADFYRNGHPRVEDVLLLIEISNTSLRYDRDVKLVLYASHGIPETWVVDLQNKRLHFFRSPKDGKYLESSSTDDPGITPLSALPDVAVDLSTLFRSM